MERERVGGERSRERRRREMEKEEGRERGGRGKSMGRERDSEEERGGVKQIGMDRGKEGEGETGRERRK